MNENELVLELVMFALLSVTITPSLLNPKNTIDFFSARYISQFSPKFIITQKFKYFNKKYAMKLKGIKIILILKLISP